MNFFFSPSASSQLLPILALIASVTTCGAWWYAALRRRTVGIFYWLAAGHSVSLGIRILSMIYMSGQVSRERLQATGSMQLLMSLVLAGLYVVLVRWLVDQPDHSR